jgi:hypothetical protein
VLSYLNFTVIDGLLGSTTVAFMEDAAIVTKLTSPVSIIITSSKMILGVCLPPNVKYPLKCASLLINTILIATSATATVPTFTACALLVAREILLAEGLSGT